MKQMKVEGKMKQKPKVFPQETRMRSREFRECK